MLEIWVESATIAIVLLFERTWSEKLAAAVVFLAPDNRGDIAGIKITIGVSSFRDTGESEPRGHVHQLSEGVGLHFLHHLAAVRLHRDLANAELPTDLFI